MRTPGQWKAKGRTVVSTLNPEYDTVVAQIPVGLSNTEKTANARLIAAAPELLDALVWLRHEIPKLKGEISLLGIEKVDEVILKAKP